MTAVEQWVTTRTVKTSYFICATPRSGSSLLCDVLAGTGLAGKPEEYFWKLFEPEWSRHWEVDNYADYVRSAMSETATDNGVFGAKIMWEHLDYFVDQLRSLDGRLQLTVPQLLSATFPNLQYIWIQRCDLVRQAVSLSRARQTDIWNDWGRVQPAKQEAVFDFEGIDRLVQEIADQNAAWQHFFAENKLPHLTVTYESLAQNPEAVGLEALRYLDIRTAEPITFVAPRLRKQADDLSEEWVRRYHAMKAPRDLDRGTHDGEHLRLAVD